MKSVIVGLARTPIGRFGGAFKPLRATDLGAAAIGGARGGAALGPDAVDEGIFGHVVQAGAGQITARQAANGAGIPMTVPATTVNKVCLSGLTAIAMADRSIRLDESSVVVAGGMESMTNAPYLLPDARWGGRLGHGPLVDAMQHDGLWCAFDECSMGESADAKNEALGISREEQDEWSAASHERAASARDSGHFAAEIVPVDVPARRGETVRVEQDEGIRDDATAESLGRLRPVFTPEGSTTAGNASQISDGGAAVVVAREGAAADHGAAPLAAIV
ncbi:MAG: acetyl-CoA C-acyltransferase, partial [Dehalococcoidia bacterium]|nr:acetyl-CoA C-acyltransferase [Dehalococcoidia bacterium]